MPSSPEVPTPVCISCRKDIDEGSVIAFGDALFHLDCFCCAKCSRPVDCNSNLLLLTDGRPVCEDCSYVCVACKQAIRDEAVMTGEEAYHANCFRCCSCKLKIDDLVFTQTNKGIFCTPCNEYRKTQRQRKRDERDQRRKQGNGPTQPVPSTSSPSRLSRMVDSQVIADYVKMQRALAPANDGDQNGSQVRISPSDSAASSTITTTASPRLTSSSSFADKYNFHQPHNRPPTPSRSRSGSEENLSHIAKSNRTMLKSPTSPPSSGSSTPAPAPSRAGNRLSSIPSASSSAESLSKKTSSPESIYQHNDGNASRSTLADASLTPATATTSTAATATVTTASSISNIPSLNLSFFDNDSGDLLNLSQSLGANIAVSPLKPSGRLVQSSSTPASKLKPAAVKSLASGASAKFSKATELLSSSLRQAGSGHSNSSWNEFPQPPTGRGLRQSPSLMSLRSMETRHQDNNSNNSNKDMSVLKLQADLKAANAKIAELNTNYNKIKEASARALDEFSKAKAEFNREVTLRRQCEFTVLHLQKQLASQHQSGGSENKTAENISPLDNSEIERLAELRVGLEQACNELRATRDVISSEIENVAEHEQGGFASSATATQDLRKTLEIEIKSLKQERDSLKTETLNLGQLRDDVINEMVILQSQNADLTTMNNDLTRRVDEREREAAAVMAGTSFLNPTSSSSTDSRSGTSMQRKSSEASLDIRTVSSRDSFNGTQAPKLFKMKKSSSNMFARFANKSKTDVSSSGASIYSMQNASYSTQSLMSEHPRREVRQGSKQSNHSGLQLSGSPPAGSSFHAFQATAFIRPVKCGVCFEKMWGLSEYRCQGCALSIHGKCLSHAPQLCFAATSSSLDLLSSPSDSISPMLIKGTTTMFGNDLGMQAMSEDRSVPLIVEKCIEAVELRGMDYEGIYRKSGGAAQMRAIQAAFDRDSNSVDLTDEELYNDICSVTSVLKQYFRELPNPLLTFDLYGQFIDAVSSQSKHDRFHELLSQLPKSNYDTLKLLLQHLCRVSEKSQENRMTSKNLALVFAPTIIRDKDSSRDLLDMSYTNALMEYLISSAKVLFNLTDSGIPEEIQL